MIFLKMFSNKHEFDPIIPNNGVIGIDPCKIKWALVGPNIKEVLFEIKMNLSEVLCVPLMILYYV